MKNSSDTIGDQTRDLQACTAVPQPTVLLRAPMYVLYMTKMKKIKKKYVYNLNHFFLDYKCKCTRNLLIMNREGIPKLTCDCVSINLTHCGRVMQICVFNMVNLGTSASSP